MEVDLLSILNSQYLINEFGEEKYLILNIIYKMQK